MLPSARLWCRIAPATTSLGSLRKRDLQYGAFHPTSPGNDADKLDIRSHPLKRCLDSLVHIVGNQQDEPPAGLEDAMKFRKRIHHGLTVGGPKRLCDNQIEMTGVQLAEKGRRQCKRIPVQVLRVPGTNSRRCRRKRSGVHAASLRKQARQIRRRGPEWNRLIWGERCL